MRFQASATPTSADRGILHCRRLGHRAGRSCRSCVAFGPDDVESEHVMEFRQGSRRVGPRKHRAGHRRSRRSSRPRRAVGRRDRLSNPVVWGFAPWSPGRPARAGARRQTWRVVSTTGTVRKAGRADRDAVVAIDDIAVGGSDDRCALLDGAIQSGHCLVLDRDHSIAGFVVTVPNAFFGRDFVELLMVERTRRRAGVGRRLLQAAVDSASTSREFTSTNCSNWPMRTLLEQDGWTLSGELLGLDANDPEIVYFADRPYKPSCASDQQPSPREPPNST